MGVNGLVTFHGWCDRDKVAALIDQAKVVAFPSIYPESFGIIGIEAMMHGKPVVAFDNGGVGDWLRNGETGFLVQTKNIKGFSVALLRLLKDRELRKRMSSRAREIVSEEFSETQHMSHLTAIYERVASMSDFATEI